MSQGQVVGLNGCQGDVTVSALVADPADLSQHPHGLLAWLRLHRVTGEVRVTTITGLKLLLLTPTQFPLNLNLVQRMVLIRRGDQDKHHHQRPEQRCLSYMQYVLCGVTCLHDDVMSEMKKE